MASGGHKAYFAGLAKSLDELLHHIRSPAPGGLPRKADQGHSDVSSVRMVRTSILN